jgi:hypothetical protein
VLDCFSKQAEKIYIVLVSEGFFLPQFLIKSNPYKNILRQAQKYQALTIIYKQWQKSFNNNWNPFNPKGNCLLTEVAVACLNTLENKYMETQHL